MAFLLCSQAAQRQIGAETAKQQLQAIFSAFGLRTCSAASSTVLVIDVMVTNSHHCLQIDDCFDPRVFFLISRTLGSRYLRASALSGRAGADRKRNWCGCKNENKDTKNEKKT